MKKAMLCALAALAIGCGGASYVRSDAALGRVVVYKNGVAYFERYAEIDGDSLELRVPPEQVDDFLKSLTIEDARTGKPAPIAYPTAASTDSGLVDMSIPLPGPAPHRVRLSYVTEAPAWKPTYRVVLGDKGKVELSGWAIVDNASGEDWHAVKLGVASSSALSFRFDLRSLRVVQRETLDAGDRVALAPPSGGSPYSAEPARPVVGELTDREIAIAKPAPPPPPTDPADAGRFVERIGAGRAGVGRQLDQARAQRDVVKVLCLQDKLTQLDAISKSAGERRTAMDAARAHGDDRTATHEAALLAVMRQRGDQLIAEANQCLGEEAGFVGGSTVTMSIDPSVADPEGERGPSAPSAPPPAPIHIERPPPNDLASVAERLIHSGRRAKVEGYAGEGDADPDASSLERASAVRDELVRRGVVADRLEIEGMGRKAGRAAGARVFETGAADPPRGAAAEEPVGAAHFESDTPMTVPKNGSAMISIVKAQTAGEVAYLYDPESVRGNTAFAFRAVRLVNPTDSALESGPVTVFGDGRFIGEGLCDPIPARGVAFVPFALDRQVVVDPKASQRQGIARVISVQRGVLSAEAKRVRSTALTITNRSGDPAVVFVRHTVPEGYELGDAPSGRERLGGAWLFRVEVPPRAKQEIAIEDVAPALRTFDVRSPAALAEVRAFVSGEAVDDRLRAAVKAIAARSEKLADLEERIASARREIDAQRARMDDTKTQIVALRGAKSGAPVVAKLEKRLGELDDRVAKITMDLVALEEQRLVARRQLDDDVGGLSLDGLASTSGTGTAKGSAAP